MAPRTEMAADSCSRLGKMATNLARIFNDDAFEAQESIQTELEEKDSNGGEEYAYQT